MYVDVAFVMATIFGVSFPKLLQHEMNTKSENNSGMHFCAASIRDPVSILLIRQVHCITNSDITDIFTVHD